MGTQEDSAGLAERRKLDQLIRRLKGKAKVPASTTVDQAVLPLVPGQRRLWLQQRLAPGNSIYNLAGAVELSGELETAALSAALDRLRQRHPALRVRVIEQHHQPVQQVEPWRRLALAQVDLERLEPGDSRREAERLARSEGARPFDLARGPLLRALLIRRRADRHTLLLVLHHVICDGGSLEILARELVLLYQAQATGQPAPLAPLGGRYQQVTQDLASPIDAEEEREEIEYWRQQLAGAPALELPADLPRPALMGTAGQQVEVTLSASETAQLEALARAQQTTLFAALAALFAAFASRLSGQLDVTLGTPVSGRESVASEGLVGCFVNTLALRADLTGGPSARQLIGRLKEVVLAAHEHRRLPFERLVEGLKPVRDPSTSPIFQTLFSVEESALAEVEAAGVSFRPRELPNGGAKFDLSLIWRRSQEGLSGVVEARRDLFQASTVQRWARQLVCLVRAALAAPDRPVHRLSLMERAQQAQVTSEWARTGPAPSGSETLVELFLAQAAKTPERPALRRHGEQLSYRQLERGARTLAAELRRRGVGPEVVVGVCQERDFELVTSLLAVLLAGGAYLPLDPVYPAQRLELLLEDAGALLVIGRAATLDRCLPGLAQAEAAAPKRLPLEDLGQLDADPASRVTTPLPTPLPEQLAYLISTSGSTGRPKAVAITHRSAAARVRWAGEAFSPDELEVVLAATSVCFDLSVFELFGPLCHGGSVVVARDALELAELPERSIVTLLNTVPSAATELVAGGLPANLRVVNLAGEPLRRRLVDAIYQQLPAARVLNLYGPSEDTTYSTGSAPALVGDSEPTLGRPLPGTRALVLDHRLGLAPMGAIGELHLGGIGLARGYLHRPGLTAERFVADPLAQDPGARVYRTGDLVRQRHDGELELTGRVDQQVKVRGFRIELGEIEALLAARPEVREVCVTVSGSAESASLTAYVVPSSLDQAGELVAAVRGALRERLPVYMVPGRWQVLDELPRLPNGKIDRSSLPEPRHGSTDSPARAELSRVPEPSSAATVSSPRAELERQLASLWAELLEVERVGVEDNFFDLGGHSLLVARLQRELQGRFGCEISASELFQYPTVSALATRLAGVEAPSLPAPRVPQPVTAVGSSGSPPIAVIGMAGRFPGAANVEQLWQNLRAGHEGITFYERQQLLDAGVDPQLLDHPDYVPAWGSIDDAELFDAALFGLPPREAELLDPQQRLLLECGWHALEAAGYGAPRSERGRVGVFAGVGYSGYIDRAAASSTLSSQLQALIANDKDFVASRLAYKLDLKGPAVTVQTACSTSLVAVHMACRSLASGECEMAIAGGAAVRLPRVGGYLYQQQGILSADGHCRAFDAAAGGTVPGNGVGLVVLKPLELALADGDPIAAVIRGSAINNDGALKMGYTAPSVEGQAEVVADAYRAAAVDPATVGYLEAHGTGTALGDPIELAALRRVWDAAGATEPCALGSVKTNLGHLDAAAGIAGLIKAVLAVQYGELPPTLHFQSAPPELDLGPFRVQQQLGPWPREQGAPVDGSEPTVPRRAGVSSFGIGGTNAHVVLEQAPPAAERPPVALRPQLVVLSAASETALRQSAEQLAERVADSSSLADASPLADLAHTLRVGRRPLAHRAVAVADDLQSLGERLSDRGSGLSFGHAPAHAAQLVFLFPGQGAQRAGMGRGLYAAGDTYKTELDRCCQLLEPRLGIDLRSLLLAADDRADEANRRLRSTELAQPALFAVEYSLARWWWQRCGAPAAMVGHSVGEIAAACLAGVLTLEDALTLVTERGRLMAAQPVGAMLSVPLASADLERFLVNGVELAADNAADRAVLSGSPEQIDSVAEILRREGVETRRLATSHAFHSAMMEPVLEPLGEVLAGLDLRSPELPYLSNLDGDWVRPEQVTQVDYWLEHLRRPVRFGAAAERLLAEPDRIYLEVGPGRALTSLLRRAAGGSAGRGVLTSLPAAGGDEQAHLLETAGRLWLAGQEVDWQPFAAAGARRVVLPGYPFEGQRYWLEPAARQQPAQQVPAPQQLPSIDSALEGLRSGGVYLFWGEHSAMAEALADRLRREIDAKPVRLSRPSDDLPPTEQAEDGFLVLRAESSDLQAVTLALAGIEDRLGKLAGIFYFGGWPTDVEEACGPGEARQRLDQQIAELQTLEQMLAAQRPDFVLLTYPAAGRVAAAQRPTAAAFAGYCSAWAEQQEQTVATAVEWSAEDLADDPIEAATLLLRALASGRSKISLSAQTISGSGVAEPDATAALATTQPVPGHARPAIGTPFESPSNAAEEQIAQLWGELLGIGEIGRNDDFYELGGDSLLATELGSRLQQQFGRSGAGELPLAELMRATTVAAQARWIEGPTTASSLAESGAIARSGAREFPLSVAQQSLWILEQAWPGEATYHLASAFELRGRLRPAALDAAFAQLAHRHETLRSRFVEGDAGVVQQPVEPFVGHLPTVDLSPLTAGDRALAQAAVERLAARQPFDLTRAPLWRAVLVRHGAQHHELVLVLHHLVADGLSNSVLAAELSELYPAACSGRVPVLPNLPIQYGEFAAAERQRLQAGAYDEALARWRQRLAAAESLELPTDRPRPTTGVRRGAWLAWSLEPAVVQSLKTLARERRSSLFGVLMTSWLVLLGRLSGQRRLTVGTVFGGRLRPELQSLVGDFANAQALAAEIRDQDTFSDLLARVGGSLHDALSDQELPFERLVEAMQPERQAGRTPFFDTMLVMQPESPPVSRLGDLAVRPRALHTATAKFDLTLDVTVTEGALVGRMEYATELWDRATVEAWLAAYGDLLSQIARQPEQPLRELSLVDGVASLSPSTFAQRGDWPIAGNLGERFATVAARRGEAEAVRVGNDASERLTYAELDRRANRLAHRLRALGVGTDQVVGLAADRGLGLVVGVLGILKAGGAYLPLDPAYPRARLDYMLADAQVTVVVGDAGGVAELNDFGGRLVELDAPADRHEGVSDTAPEIEIDPQHLAYVIYTSGSTGRPKGVAVTHGNVLRLLDATAEDFGFGDDDVWTLFHSFAFDFSVWELWGALAFGGRLVVVPYTLSRSPVGLRELLVSEGVTVLNQTPSAFDQLVGAERSPAPAALTLRWVVFGGEALDLARLAPWFEHYGAMPRLVNMYGITETTVHVTHREVTQADLAGDCRSPIGPPIADLALHLTDLYGQPIPHGALGEMWVGGAGLARGYLGRPGLTAERFVPDSFGALPGARLYRSGDLARRRPDGELEFVGRADSQVKIRGFRIELGEVEAVLAAAPEVRHAVAMVRQGKAEDSGDLRLVAYVVPTATISASEADSAAWIETLRQLAQAHLPAHMQPAAIVALDALPLTTNGKLDRAALPAPGWAGQASGREPEGPWEIAVARLFADQLGIERVGADDGFFELGGHSLLATRLVARLRQELQIELPLGDFFAEPTVAAVARSLDRQVTQQKDPAESLVERPPTRPLPAPLAVEAERPASSAQERMWFLQQLDPGSGVYNVASVLRTSAAIDRQLLTRALALVIDRHQVLRTVYRSQAGRPRPQLAVRSVARIAEVDLRSLNADDRPAEASRLAAEELRRPFDLATGPVLRLGLIRRSSQVWLTAVVHHAAFDGWSVGLLRDELSAAHAALTVGRVPSLVPLALQYGDYAAWQRDWMAGNELQQQLAYWRDQLAGAPDLELPTDRPRPARWRGRGHSLELQVDPARTAALERLARQRGTTLFTTLVAGLQATLHRWSGQSDLSVGSVVAGRPTAELERLIGLFVNTLVLRSRSAEGAQLDELLQQTALTCQSAFAHQELPFDKLVEELRPQRDPSRHPLFQVALTLNDVESAAQGNGGSARLEFEEVDIEAAESHFDLALMWRRQGDGLSGRLEYASDLFDETTARRFIAMQGRLLTALVETPEHRLDDLDLLSAAERHQLLHEWHADPLAEMNAEHRQLSIHGLVAEWSRQTPAATALRCQVGDGWRELSYGDLDLRADLFAALLRRRGLCPGEVVAISAEVSLERLIALLAVLKCGAAYLPMDPSQPAERQRLMIEDSGTRLLLSDQAESFASNQVESLDLVEAVRQSGYGQISTGQEQAHDLGGEALAMVIYTSGSTGRPKGLGISHRGVVRLLRDADIMRRQPGDHMPQLVNFSFDPATYEIWAPLAAGGCLVMPNREVVLSATRMKALIRDQKLDDALVTTGLFHQLVAEDPTVFTGLRQLIFGGELADPNRIRDLLRGGPPQRILNVYGPTECTVMATYHEASQLADSAQAVSIGRPVPYTSVYTVDQRLRPQPLGTPGQLMLGGDGLAHGYLGLPARTASTFVPDPFGGRPGARLYATGDLVRFDREGRLDFIGRIDRQVKIRGFRLEPGEIETALLGLPQVEEVAVEVRLHGAEKRLVAYLTTAGLTSASATSSAVTASVTNASSAEYSAEAEIAEIRQQLGDRLPEYMVPAAFVVLDSLPLNANGKIDRTALPAPEWRGGGEAPTSALERRVAALFAEVLKVEAVGRGDNFFELGGHSLLASQLAARLRDELEVELPLRELFAAPTVAALAEQMEIVKGHDRSSLGEDLAPIPPLLPQERTSAELPLSFAQERLWFIDRLQPGRATYNIAAALILDGPLDASGLAAAAAALLERHESLRTTFVERGGEPRQRIAAAPERSPLDRIDLRGLGANAGAKAEELASAAATQSFDLAAGPLARFGLLRIADRRSVLTVVVHHIIADGWSARLLIGELMELYSANRAGQPSALAPPQAQYVDYARWQRDWLAGPRLSQQLDYWRQQLEGAPPVELPADRPRPATLSGSAGSVPARLSNDLRLRLEALAAPRGATLFMTLLAGFATFVGRLTVQSDVVFGTPFAGRRQAGTEGLVGLLVNTLPLRLQLGGETSFDELIDRARQTVLGAEAHQDVPFERLVEELQPERRLSASPLFQILFALDDDALAELQLPELEVSPLYLPAGGAKFDLTCAWSRGAEGLEGVFEYSRELYDRETVERWAGLWTALLEAAVESPQTPVDRLPMLAASERAELLASFAPARAAASSGTVHGLFEPWADRSPDAVAVTVGAGGERLEYGELERRSNALAHRLSAAGLAGGQVVGLVAERGVGLVVGILGILKAGGAYLPLDPAYPAARLEYMLDDASCALLVADGSNELAGFAGRLLPIDSPPEAPTQRPSVTVDPDQLAYVIYTSGSTGRPKGVGVTHRNVVRLMGSTQGDFTAGPDDVWTLFHSYAFDFSVWELWGALAWGGRLVVVPYWVSRAPDQLLDLLVAEQVTVLNQTPSAFRQLMATDQSRPPARLALRWVIFGGEALEPAVLQPWIERYGDTSPRLVNMYGITETTVHVTRRELSSADLTAPCRSPIGPPLADLGIYLLDHHGEPVARGIAGEMSVTGAGLARGYLRRPELTAARFVPDPFAQSAGARLYRSGDLARWRNDGELEFMGRADQQVKIRGFRIEPGEIEACLVALPEVAQAAVLVREDMPSDRRLVAYAVLTPEVQTTTAELLRQVADELPVHMVPAALVELDQLPLTPTGKLDRRALPAPSWGAEEGAYEAPRTTAEAQVADLFGQLLGAERVGAEDDFFALGGHSLLAVRLIARLRDELGVELPLASLFSGSTVAAVASTVESIRLEAGQPVAPPLRASGDLTTPAPLSFAQERLWFLDRLAPGDPTYHLALVLGLKGDLRPAALATALAGVVERQTALRTTFASVNGKPVQIVAPAGHGQALPLVDLSCLEPAGRAIETARLLRREVRRPFDLATGPLLRCVLLRLERARHQLLINQHHIVSDGWSQGVFFTELVALYEAAASGRPSRLSNLPELPVSFADYARWQRGWLEDEALAQLIEPWRQRLTHAETIELPTDRPRPAVRRGTGSGVAFQLPAELAERLRGFAEGHRATLFMTLLAVFRGFLWRLGGQPRVAIGTPVANRGQLATEPLVGFFVNTLALVVDASGDPPFEELVERSREVALDGFSRQETPFEKLVEALRPPRDLSHTPLFQVMLVLQNTPLPELSMGGLELSAEPLETGSAKFELTLALVDRGTGALDGELEYDHDLFDRSTVERLGRLLVRLTDQSLQDPQRPLSRLSWLSPSQRHQLLAEIGSPISIQAPAPGVAAWPAGGLERLFEAAAQRQPQDIAVTFDDGSQAPRELTWSELDQRSAQLAWALIERGAGPERVVAVALGRSLDLVVALLGVVRSGAAYLPLDPSYPVERLALMLEDADAVAVVSDSATSSRLPTSAPALLSLDDDAAELAKQSTEAPRVEAGGERAAYLLYTSGSTGRPKGVWVTHDNVRRLLGSTDHWFGFGRDDVWSLFHSYAFDFSVWELWGALALAGRLVVVPYETSRDPAAFYDLLSRQKVTVLNQTPSAFAQLVRHEERHQNAGKALPELALRWVIFGGEALDPSALKPWIDRHGDQQPRLVNMYGITETTVHVTYREVSATDTRSAASLIGEPIPDLGLYVVDPALEPAPLGVGGELLVSGAGLARGYHRQAGLTAVRFIPDPFGTVFGGRLYRSGDLARRRPDGELEYLGRGDQQLKVRGFRIEAGEIEAALASHPEIDQAVVAPRPDGRGEDLLAAWVVPRNSAAAESDTSESNTAESDTAPSVEELRTHLRQLLPEHMIPNAWMVLAELPLTENGKLDRRALPAPRAAEVGTVAPRSPLEEELAAVWAEVLGIERPGIYDNFFDLGGHSLLIVEVQALLEQRLGRQVPVLSLFQYPTLATLAEHLGEDSSATLTSALGQSRSRAETRRSRAGRQRTARRRSRRSEK